MSTTDLLLPKDQSSSSGLVIAADLGGTNLRAATVDAEGRIHERVKYQTPKAERADEIVRALVGAARELERLSGGRGAQIKSLSVVVPGTVQVENGIVTKAPNVPCLDGFRLGAALESELRWPAVLENDANAAAVGELWQGAGRGAQTIICVTLGTGVGGGIILDGELWRGIDGSAGEIGHIGVEPTGHPCMCGSRGCLEVYASATAIVRMTREAQPRYPRSTLHTRENLTAEMVYRSGLDGDELALEVFRRMGFYLGVGLASLINILNPEMIVVGGGVAEGWQLFYEHVHEQVMKRAFPIPARRAEIVRAERGDDAGLLGAAHIAFTKQSK
ncbi:MAG TPA: ROK family protein [Pyrinomonadaceae bacterium]|jgi:glucokinase|nr:ROK family protein [Pyrinomonadaceae bacterium]